MKKILCILFSMILFLSCFSAFIVYADVQHNESKVELLQEGDLPDTDISFSSSVLDEETLNKVKDDIYRCMIDLNNFVYIDKYNVPTSEIALIYSNVINNNPELFYVSSNLGYTYFESSKTVARVEPTYTLNASEITEQKIIFDNEIKHIVSLTDDSMSDLQKALTVHDYICSLAIYPNLNYYGDKAIYHSAYGFVKDRNIVCAGYALIYSAVMKSLDIPCRYVISEKMKHAWNAICIDNKWYNVDLTFDDTTYTSTNSNDMGKYSHKYFMKSTDNYQTYKNHNGMIYPDNIECTDTTYDSAFWDNYTCNIITYNGDYYYLDVDTENFALRILKRDIKGNTSVLNKNNYLSVYGKYSDGVIMPYAQIVKINDVLYFTASLNDTADLYCYDLKTDKEYTIKKINGKCGGLGEINGTLYYALTSDTQNYIEINKLDMFDNLYPGTSNTQGYSPYVDINHDGYINAKDYVQIKK